MNKISAFKSLFAVSVFAVGLTAVAVTGARADALYQPYYYVMREPLMNKTPLQGDVTAAHQEQYYAPSTTPQIYTPDDRLSDTTNRRLAQGNQVPMAPPLPRIVELPSNLPLGTIGGLQIGIQGSDYLYTQRDTDVHHYGIKYGVTADATASLGNRYFASADFRYGYGPIDYHGAGQSNGQSDNLWEVRGLVGRDFMWGDHYSLSPYAGFGYRQLDNDGRGLSSTNVPGYRQESQYFYVPIGVMPRVRLNSDNRVALTLEYDQMLRGEQTSKLNDQNLGNPNITNQQNFGWGMRGDLMWETAHWSVGPFFSYWNVNSAKTKYAGTGSCAAGCTVPDNWTTEVGAQVKYRFMTF